MVGLHSFITLALALSATASPFFGPSPSLRRQESDDGADFRLPENPPGPLKFNGTKLVNDADHPWMPLREGDIRGPCPALNTLASHGYLPRNGVATPTQLINAVQEGFNMHNLLAKQLVSAGLLVDGNVMTNLLSIGAKTPLTGPDPPAPAIVGGLNTHGPFEGDAGLTRADAFFGDNHSFNETLFDELVAFSNKYGAGKYNLTVAGEYRFQRIQDSIATNPTFQFKSARYIAAYGESVFPLNFFIDGRNEDGQLDLEVARGFFQDSRMPEDFHRRSQPGGGDGLDIVFAAHPMQPGGNVGGINNYVIDTTAGNFSTPCLLYEGFVNGSVRDLYPNPTGALRKALNFYLNIFYEGLGPNGGGCQQVFPYGKDD